MFGGLSPPNPHVATGLSVYSANVGEFMSWLTFSWGLSSVWKLVIMKYDLVSNRL